MSFHVYITRAKRCIDFSIPTTVFEPHLNSYFNATAACLKSQMKLYYIHTLNVLNDMPRILLQ